MHWRYWITQYKFGWDIVVMLSKDHLITYLSQYIIWSSINQKVRVNYHHPLQVHPYWTCVFFVDCSFCALFIHYFNIGMFFLIPIIHNIGMFFFLFFLYTFIHFLAYLSISIYINHLLFEYPPALQTWALSDLPSRDNSRVHQFMKILISFCSEPQQKVYWCND